MKKSSEVKRKISDRLDLPREVVMNVPTLKLIGLNELYIENHKGIVEYGENILRINTSIGVVKIIGETLLINEINQEEIEVVGEIQIIEFIR